MHCLNDFLTHCEEIYNFMLIPPASAGLQILQDLQTFLGIPDPAVGIEWCTYYLKKPCFSLPFITLFTFTMNIYLQNTRLSFCQIKICETLLNRNIKALKMTLYMQEKKKFYSRENSVPQNNTDTCLMMWDYFSAVYRKDTKFLVTTWCRHSCNGLGSYTQI